MILEWQLKSERKTENLELWMMEDTAINSSGSMQEAQGKRAPQNGVEW